MICEVISCREAERRGLKHYFTGKPCRHGHIAQRYVANNKCVTCTVERVIAWQRANPEKKRAKQRRYDAKRTPEQKLAESKRDHRTERQRREARLAEVAGRPRPNTCDVCVTGNEC